MRNLGNLHSLHFPIYWRLGHSKNDGNSCIVMLLRSILGGRVLELRFGGGDVATISDCCNFPPTPLFIQISCSSFHMFLFILYFFYLTNVCMGFWFIFIYSIIFICFLQFLLLRYYVVKVALFSLLCVGPSFGASQERFLAIRKTPRRPACEDSQEFILFFLIYTLHLDLLRILSLRTTFLLIGLSQVSEIN